jgi:hypothetical protein
MMIIKQLALRSLYALHMLAPAGFVWWHMGRLSPDTVQGLATLFR